MIGMSEGSLQNFITVLENLPQSVTVEMEFIRPRTEYERFRENILGSQTFYVIQDRWQFKFKTIKPSKSTKMDSLIAIEKKKPCTIS